MPAEPCKKGRLERPVRRPMARSCPARFSEVPTGKGLSGYLTARMRGYLIEFKGKRGVTSEGYMGVIFWEDRGYMIDF